MTSDHLWSNVVPTAVMAFIAVTAVGAGARVVVRVVGAYLRDVRQAWRVEARQWRQAGYDEQIVKTVPMLAASPKDADR